ncbi:MAG: RNA polymerase sigma factor [Polyangia bacterium]
MSTVLRLAAQSSTAATDASLVQAGRRGEAWAQEELFRRHGRMAIGLAHRLVPNDPEVDDIVQDCFVSALRRLHKLENPQAFSSWLGSIVVHAVSNHLRRRRLLSRLGLITPESVDLDAIASPDAPAEVAVELRRVYALLQHLPVEQRVALVLRRIDGMEIPQIALNMGLSSSTVKRRLKAAEEALERSR